jgi:purine-binding chemotaxis protein CheW
MPSTGTTPVTRSLSQEFLSFSMGDEEYGIDILKVQEIRGYEQPTRMVGTPAYVKGVCNLRGIIVPIIDLRMKFGLPSVSYDALTITVILNVADRVVGVVVDSVSDVVELGPADIKPAPGFSGAISSACVTGIGSLRQNDADRMLILLDIDSLVSNPDIALSAQTVQ